MTFRLGYFVGTVATVAAGRRGAYPPFPPPRCASARPKSRRTSRSSLPATTLEVNAALFSAADKRCVALARRLLADGASLKARDRFGATPRSRAAKFGDVEIVDLFLEHGADIDARDLDGSTALYVAAEQAGIRPSKR